MRARTNTTIQQPAFSLVELIVVVVVIGILAAIAIPRLSRGTAKSGARATQCDLALLQRQIDLYAGEHGGVYPGFNQDGDNSAHTEEAFLAQLTMFSKYDGKTKATSSPDHRYGPYLRKGMPVLKIGPKQGLNGVVVVTGSTELTYQESADAGWLYNDTTGQIVTNSPTQHGATDIIEPEGWGGGWGGQGTTDEGEMTPEP